MRSVGLTFRAAVVLGVFGLSAAHAVDPAAMIKYRQNTMKAAAGHMAALSAIVKDDVGLRTHLPGHASAIAETAAMVSDLFPKGSEAGETDALPAIWEKPAEFSRAAEAARASGAKLATAARAQNLEAVKAAQAELGGACKGCHEAFRRKK
ncbi:MAG: cytochrome c [Deltaproteobacteria bacterium]|nr:cytochrome c [Deltaproteobacteria bacterium]